MRGRPKEPGFKAMPVPEHNDMRPFANTPQWRDEARMGLQYVQGKKTVMDIAAPAGPVAMSPASARYTVGLRKSNIGPEKDPQPFTIQDGVKRQ